MLMSCFEVFSITLLIGIFLYLPNHNASCKALRYTTRIDSKRASSSNDETSKANNNVLKTYFQHEPFGPNTYAFGFKIEDKNTGNRQFRDERRYLNGSIAGSFGFALPNGRMTATRFMADKQSGYVSQSESFNVNNTEKWQEYWPITNSGIFIERPETMAKNTTYDNKIHLNVTLDDLTANITRAVKSDFGVDLNHIDVQKDLGDSVLLDVVNGKIPLKVSKTNINNSTAGFEIIENFVPKTLPIEPFLLSTTNKVDDEALNATTQRVAVS